jgi:hypothetical protein
MRHTVRMRAGSQDQDLRRAGLRNARDELHIGIVTRVDGEHDELGLKLGE